MSDVVTEVSAILAAGGFRPMPQGDMRGLFCKECAGGWWMGGVYGGNTYSKHTAMSSDTTYDPIQAAHELVALVSPRKTLEQIGRAYSDANDLAMYGEPEESAGHEAHEETGAEAVGAISASDGDELGSGDDVSVRLPARLEHVDALGTEGLDDVSDEDADDERAEPDLGAEILDADYSEPIDLLVEGSDFADVATEPDAPIAYAASDLDALVREKLGRLSQIARAKKGVLQEGWNLAEFSYLQNLIQRMERGEAPDDQSARDRFFAISELSRAMSRVDKARDDLEAQLEQIGRARDYVGAVDFDPEAGWGELR